MFLEGTFHIFLFYLIIGLILTIPPFMDWWKRLVFSLNNVKISGRTLYKLLIPVFSIVLIISILLIHFFQSRPELNLSFYLVFSPSAFLLIPLFSGFFGVLFFVKNKKEIGLGNLGVLLFSFGGFGLASSNIHDVVWCAKATNLYTQFTAGGHDLSLWLNTLNAPNYDYRIFGTYMLIQTIVLLAMAHANLLAFFKIKETKINFKSFKLNWLAIIPLSLAIILIDWPKVISPPSLHTFSISIAVIVSIFIFRRSGLILNEIISENT